MESLFEIAACVVGTTDGFVVDAFNDKNYARHTESTPKFSWLTK